MRGLEVVGDMSTVASGGYSTKEFKGKGRIFGFDFYFDKSDGAAGFDEMTNAEIAADIATIKIILDPISGTRKEIFDVTPETLIKWENWRNGTDSAYAPKGIVKAPFTRNRMPKLYGRSAMGIDMHDVSKLVIQVYYKENALFKATRVKVKVDIDEEIQLPLTTYPVLYETETEINTIGSKELEDLPSRIKHAGILGIHLTGYNHVELVDRVRFGNRIIRQEMNVEEHNRFAHDNGRIPQTDMLHFDFQQHRGYLPIGSNDELNAKITWKTAPGAITYLVDMLMGLEAA